MPPELTHTWSANRLHVSLNFRVEPRLVAAMAWLEILGFKGVDLELVLFKPWRRAVNKLTGEPVGLEPDRVAAVGWARLQEKLSAWIEDLDPTATYVELTVDSMEVETGWFWTVTWVNGEAEYNLPMSLRALSPVELLAFAEFM